MDSLGLSQSTLLDQDGAQKWNRSDDSQRKSSEVIVMTHILATDIAAGLHHFPAGIYVAVDINGVVTKTSSQPLSAKVEWDPEIFVPLDRSLWISFQVYASPEIGPQTLGNDELLCECQTTLGELLNRNGQLQLPRIGGGSLPCSSLRVSLDQRVGDIDHNSQQLVVTARSGIFQKLSSLFNNAKNSQNGSLKAKAGPPIFALIIAIDKYKSENHQNLVGCNSDGERFKKFLTGMLGVPLSQIVILSDERATRDAILQQFNNHFIDNEAIEKGDAMVFFYAGHGTREVAPAGWIAESNQMEAICPHDANTVGLDGNEIYPIHDRTLSGLIRKLASRKGDNIIFILDCCHSGGATRANEISSFRVRSTQPSSQPPPLDLDREIWDSTSETLIRGARPAMLSGSYRALESHVLLAACRPNEVASGDMSGGLFTSALLKALTNCTFQDTTYTGLFERLRVRHDSPHPQHPQCMGGHRDRLLFSVTTVRHGETTFKVLQRKHELYVSAGSIHGVIVGTEFTLKFVAEPITLKAVEVDAFESRLEHHPRFSFTSSGVPQSAVMTNWNQPTLRIHSSIHQSCTHFTVVPTNESADLAVRQNGSEWEFERFDPLALEYSTPSITVHSDEVRPMLEAPIVIANFNSNLYRADKAGGSFAGEIKVRLNRVGRSTEGDVCPVGDDLFDSIPSQWFAEMEVKQAIITDLDVEYCITIENFSDVDLFPYLFYFDPSDYSVQAWYLPPGPNMSAPLQRRNDDGTPSVFAYGYGGFGTEPIEFYLPSGQTTDSGFLKVFLTNAYVDMNNVGQHAINRMRLSNPKILAPKGIWECKTFVLTCRAI